MAINEYQQSPFIDYQSMGGSVPGTEMPKLPPGYYFVNRTASNPAPARPATTKKPKAKKRKAKTRKSSSPISVSTDGGRTWIEQAAQGPTANAPLVSYDGGQTWAPETAGTNVSPGYDVNRGLDIMDAITQVYPDINPDVAAGVAGNFLYESYGLPNIYEGQTPYSAGSYIPPTGGFGIAQWTGPRRRALEAMPNANTLPAQIQYFAQENAGPERRAWEATMAAPTLEDATRTFATQWERPGVPALDRRIGYANQIRNAYDQRRFAEMQRQADVMSAMPALPLEAMPIQRPSSQMIAPQERIPVDFSMQPQQPTEQVFTIGDFIGYPKEVQPLPYNRTKEYQREVDRITYQRSGYSPQQIEAILLQDYGPQ